jgi:exodeoxyribonuclease VII small subunit
LTAHPPPAKSADMGQDADAITELSFEDALKRLEAIVQTLESGEASLDDSITLYAEGDRLRAQCEARLAAAQARIDKITLGSDGRPAGTRPFDAE